MVDVIVMVFAIAMTGVVIMLAIAIVIVGVVLPSWVAEEVALLYVSIVFVFETVAIVSKNMFVNGSFFDPKT